MAAPTPAHYLTTPFAIRVYEAAALCVDCSDQTCNRCIAVAKYAHLLDNKPVLPQHCDGFVSACQAYTCRRGAAVQLYHAYTCLTGKNKGGSGSIQELCAPNVYYDKYLPGVKQIAAMREKAAAEKAAAAKADAARAAAKADAAKAAAAKAAAKADAAKAAATKAAVEVMPAAEPAPVVDPVSAHLDSSTDFCKHLLVKMVDKHATSGLPDVWRSFHAYTTEKKDRIQEAAKAAATDSALDAVLKRVDSLVERVDSLEAENRKLQRTCRVFADMRDDLERAVAMGPRNELAIHELDTIVNHMQTAAAMAASAAPEPAPAAPEANDADLQTAVAASLSEAPAPAQETALESAQETTAAAPEPAQETAPENTQETAAPAPESAQKTAPELAQETAVPAPEPAQETAAPVPETAQMEQAHSVLRNATNLMNQVRAATESDVHDVTQQIVTTLSQVIKQIKPDTTLTAADGMDALLAAIKDEVVNAAGSLKSTKNEPEEATAAETPETDDGFCHISSDSAEACAN